MPGHTSQLQQTPSDGQWERRLLPRRRLSGPACLADIDRTLPDTDPIGLTTESPPASELARRRSLARLLLPYRLARIAWNRRGTSGQGPVAKQARRESGEQNGPPSDRPCSLGPLGSAAGRVAALQRPRPHGGPCPGTGRAPGGRAAPRRVGAGLAAGLVHRGRRLRTLRRLRWRRSPHRMGPLSGGNAARHRARRGDSPRLPGPAAPGRVADPELRTQGRRGYDDRRVNSSHLVISYAVFCLKKKKTTQNSTAAT